MAISFRRWLDDLTPVSETRDFDQS